LRIFPLNKSFAPPPSFPKLIIVGVICLVIGLSIIGASITTYLPPHHGFIACPSSQVDNHWPFWNFASCFESSREREREKERERGVSFFSYTLSHHHFFFPSKIWHLLWYILGF